MPSLCIPPSSSSSLSFHLSMAAMLISAPSPCSRRSLPSCCRNSPRRSRLLWRHQTPSHGHGPALGELFITQIQIEGNRAQKEFAFLCSLVIWKRGVPFCWRLQHAHRDESSRKTAKKESRGSKAATGDSWSRRHEAKSIFCVPRKAANWSSWA